MERREGVKVNKNRKVRGEGKEKLVRKRGKRRRGRQ
jgi:hypothetical protein